MRIMNMRRWISLSLISVAFGCNESTLPGSDGNDEKSSGQAQATPIVRNQLLTRLQGQTKEERFATVLKIIQSELDQATRRDALQYLLGFETDVEPLGEFLTNQLLIEKDPFVASDIKQVLVASKANVESVLLAAAPTADDQKLKLIIETLGDTQASSPDTIDFLRQQLNSPNLKMAMASCKSLQQIGLGASAILPDLTAIIGRPRVPIDTSTLNNQAFRDRRDLTSAAVRAMAAIGPDPSAIPALIECLTMEAEIAKSSAVALASLGPSAYAALPALRELQARNDHGGKDIKTYAAKEAASKAISAITANSP